VGATSRILDVGCSTGGTTVALAMSRQLRAEEVIGIDPNQLSLAAAEVRARGYDISPERLKYRQNVPGEPFPFANCSFDLTVSISVIEYITRPGDRAEFVAEMERVTRPGGFIFLATPNPLRFFDYHTHRFLGDLRRRDGCPWSSPPWRLRRLFRRSRAVSLHGYFAQIIRQRHRKAFAFAPEWAIGRLAAWLAPWQKILVQRNS
jgi:SAM-dependent methyltransferase